MLQITRDGIYKQPHRRSNRGDLHDFDIFADRAPASDAHAGRLFRPLRANSAVSIGSDLPISRLPAKSFFQRTRAFASRPSRCQFRWSRLARERSRDDAMTVQSRNRPAAIRVGDIHSCSGTGSISRVRTADRRRRPAGRDRGPTCSCRFFSGHLVDALTRGADDADARHAAFTAFGAIVALCLISMALRLIGLQAIVPFTLKIMSDVARDAFARVQRFSTRLARQLVCRLDRAQDHARHVGTRPAQRHHPDGAVAIAAGAVGLDDPAWAALALARRRHRGRHG